MAPSSLSIPVQVNVDQKMVERVIAEAVRRQRLKLVLVAILGLVSGLWLAGCNLQRCSEGAVCGISKVTGPSAVPSPSATATLTPTASPTPADPCKPVIGVNLSGPVSVAIGSVFKLDVTPVSPAGPLEGSLDFCNVGRSVVLDAVTANLRCVGNCASFGPQFLAQGVGAYSVTVRVEGASATFAGTVR